MGASLALGVNKKLPKCKVKALVRKKKYIQLAKKNNIKADIYTTPSYEALDSELIVLAVPVHSTEPVLKNILPFLNEKTIITDIGSTKTQVVKTAYKILKNKNPFIGSHPMCGSEKSGINFAKKGLYVNSTCIITPYKNSKREINFIKNFWESIGTKTIIMTPDEHDKYTALISHVPHIVSSTLMNYIFHPRININKIKKIFGKGYSDMTRLAEGNAVVWEGIIKTNKKHITKSLKLFNKEINSLISDIEKDKFNKIYSYLDNASKRKKKFLKLN